MDIIIISPGIGSGIDLSLIVKLIKNEETIILVIQEDDKEISFKNELPIFPLHFFPVLPIENLGIKRPKPKIKRNKEEKTPIYYNSTKPRIFFERRRK